MVRPVLKKLLFAINFLRFEAHLGRALFGGRFREETDETDCWLISAALFLIAFTYCREEVLKCDLGKKTRVTTWRDRPRLYLEIADLRDPWVLRAGGMGGFLRPAYSQMTKRLMEPAVN